MRSIRFATQCSIATIGLLTALAGCRPNNSDELAKAQAEAEKAKAEAEKAKAEADKARAEADRAKQQAAGAATASAASSQSPASPTPNPRAGGSGMSITVEVDAQKSNGKAWDVAGGAPDIALCVTSAGRTTCLPDGSGVGSVTRPECRDAFRCSFTVDVTGNDVVFDVLDVDVAANDLIGSGSCRRGSTCRLGQATVTVR